MSFHITSFSRGLVWVCRDRRDRRPPKGSRVPRGVVPGGHAQRLGGGKEPPRPRRVRAGRPGREIGPIVRPVAPSCAVAARSAGRQRGSAKARNRPFARQREAVPVQTLPGERRNLPVGRQNRSEKEQNRSVARQNRSDGRQNDSARRRIDPAPAQVRPVAARDRADGRPDPSARRQNDSVGRQPPAVVPGIGEKRFWRRRIVLPGAE